MKHIPFDSLICPLDGLPLTKRGQSLYCASNHCFDLDRKGAVHLFPVQFKASKEPGDSKEMIDARHDFLESGFYTALADKINQMVASYIALRAPKSLAVLDAGCGEGYYTTGLVRYLAALDYAGDFSCIGLDISKPAIHAASRRDKDITWVVGTNKNLPVADASIDCLLCLFGFPVWAEFKRVLKTNGIVILVDPAADHLIELRNILYADPRKKEERVFDNDIEWDLFQDERLTVNAGPVTREQIANLLVMTPHGYRAHATTKAKARSMDFPELTLDVHLRIFALKQAT